MRDHYLHRLFPLLKYGMCIKVQPRQRWKDFQQAKLCCLSYIFPLVPYISSYHWSQGALYDYHRYSLYLLVGTSLLALLSIKNLVGCKPKSLCCHSPIRLAFFALLLLYSFTCWYVLLPLAHVYPLSQITTFMILTLISQLWFLNVVFIKFPTPYASVNMKPKSNINDLYVGVGSLVEYASSSLWTLM